MYFDGTPMLPKLQTDDEKKAKHVPWLNDLAIWEIGFDLSQMIFWPSEIEGQQGKKVKV